ncbi:hypothetical protein [Leptolyngbya sp. FACHB-16]|uniref:hypothetical protein n=1 Tax=unclassified Leptolyngbya TaxID=2650499 RepID=UPI0016878359|nr:hypothetical protein [Leptolyngbya sp. FACHB-16]MBD2156898.1 hypothetical protein [Leptolyngbya sp. FACHB-16]
MTSNELHVVIGASGGTGSAIVRELVARGKQGGVLDLWMVLDSTTKFVTVYE